MRFAIKIGTSFVTDENHHLNTGFLRDFTGQLADMWHRGHDIILVSSGAVASGRTVLRLADEKKNIPFRQALAAVGQGILMKAYQSFFAAHDMVVAQALLTNYDFINRENFLNVRNVLELLLRERVIPIVNENDVTTIAELKFGDNDMLSAKVAAALSCDALVLCTDVGGLYTKNPKLSKDGRRIPIVRRIDDFIKKLAKGTKNQNSLGGMKTKIEAAAYATSSGIHAVIVNGRDKGVLAKIAQFFENSMSGEFDNGTVFPSSVSKSASQKKWLKPKLLKHTWIEVDEGALSALTENGKSLLPSGVTAVHGTFSRGDVVAIRYGRNEIGFGQINYDSESLDKIKKHHSNKIEEILGFEFEPEIIHRDRMVLS